MVRKWFIFVFFSGSKLALYTPLPVSNEQLFSGVTNLHLRRPSLERIPVIISTIAETITIVTYQLQWKAMVGRSRDFQLVLWANDHFHMEMIGFVQAQKQRCLRLLQGW